MDDSRSAIMTNSDSPSQEEAVTDNGKSVRPGGKAAGGTQPRAGDPDTPAQARARARQSNRLMREQGFGDHKGSIND